MKCIGIAAERLLAGKLLVQILLIALLYPVVRSGAVLIEKSV